MLSRILQRWPKFIFSAATRRRPSKSCTSALSLPHNVASTVASSNATKPAIASLNFRQVNLCSSGQGALVGQVVEINGDPADRVLFQAHANLGLFLGRNPLWHAVAHLLPPLGERLV